MNCKCLIVLVHFLIPTTKRLRQRILVLLVVPKQRRIKQTSSAEVMASSLEMSTCLHIAPANPARTVPGSFHL